MSDRVFVDTNILMYAHDTAAGDKHERARTIVERLLMTPKDQVRALLDRLPEDCTLDDVQYHLCVVPAAARGDADERAGRLIPHEQVASELRRRWLFRHAR
jgi:hypothetical protein